MQKQTIQENSQSILDEIAKRPNPQESMITVFNTHVKNDYLQLNKEWNQRPYMSDLKNVERLKEKLHVTQLLEGFNAHAELANRFQDLANYFNGKSLPSDPKELKDQLTKAWESRADNPHWTKVREYQHIQQGYISAKIEVEDTKNKIDATKKSFYNLNKMNSSFSRIFMSNRELKKMGSQLKSTADTLGVPLNDQSIDKLISGKKLDQGECLQLKQELTKQVQGLEAKLITAKNKVEQFREKAYNAYTQGSTFKRIFSNDRHIIGKLHEMIHQREYKKALEYKRHDRPPIASTPEIASPTKPIAPTMPIASPTPAITPTRPIASPSPIPTPTPALAPPPPAKTRNYPVGRSGLAQDRSGLSLDRSSLNR